MKVPIMDNWLKNVSESIDICHLANYNKTSVLAVWRITMNESKEHEYGAE